MTLAGDQTARPIYVHATAIAIDRFGLLIRGPSRAGKSSVALALIAEATCMFRLGILIGDDRVSVENRNGVLVLRGHPAISGKIEQRGIGILDIPWKASANATHVIDLGSSEAVFRESSIDIENVLLPRFTVPRGRDAIDRAKLILGLLRQSSDPSFLNLGSGLNH